MIMDREFSNVEKESNRNFRKRYHTSNEDYYTTRFEK
jgi:hypothetical protein